MLLVALRPMMFGAVAAGLLPLVISPALAQTASARSASRSGDAVRGETLFKQHCSVCHSADKDAKNGIGPALNGVIGRSNGRAPGFPYSSAMKAAKFTWTTDKVNQWIQKPAALVPGTKMVLAPVSQAQDRADIIEYLKSKSGHSSP